VDYAFAPGTGDSAIDTTRVALSRRPGTVVIDADGTTTLAQFLLAASIASAALGPGDLFASGHGSAEGELLLKLDAALPALTTFESVAAARNSGNIRIPANLNTGHTNVCLTSCLLGSDDCRPFLQLLKMALGNPNSVSAPRFLHVYVHPNGTDLFEAMLYDFWIVGNDGGRKPLTTRDEAVAKFRAGAFKYFDGTDVPADSWAQWVPPAAQLKFDTAGQDESIFHVPVLLQSGAFEMQEAHWLSQLEEVTFTIDSNVVPVGQEVIVDTLRDELPLKPDFASHLYPVYRRHHFNTLEDFIQGWNWKVTESNNQLKFVGTRYTYHLWIPVTKPGTAGEWICNFYPASGNPSIAFTPDNQPYRLFGIV
jgi:hypothetical protein